TDLPATNVLGTTTVVTGEALASDVLLGKQLFYDALDNRLARDDYMSCASCHNDGSTDGRVWDLGAFGEGIRLTQSLRGRGLAHGRLHWTGNFDEVQDFEGQIRSLAGGTGLMANADFAATEDPLGAPKAGLSADLDALAAYVTSLSDVPLNPNRAASGLSGQARSGRDVFVAQGCASCHAGASMTDSGSGALHDIGTITPASGQRSGATLTGFDTPTLLGLWERAPYLHNGSAATIADAIAAHDSVTLSSADLAALGAFLREVTPADVPAAGPQACVSPANIAPGGTASQSSGYGGNAFPAALAIDLNPGNYTHTGSTDRNSTWTLDFAAPQRMETIVLYNRTSCCGSRLRDIRVQVFRGAALVYASDLLNPENVLNSPATLVIDLPAALTGDRVVVTRQPDTDLSGTNGAGNRDEAGVLSLAEVVIEGCPL
ncbi:MAG: cytochrome c peroxidase, partial [Pseudomonadota bacterium]